MIKKESIIYTKMLEVARWIFNCVNTFPKKQRFVVGQQIENSTLAIIRLIIEANGARSTEEAVKKLDVMDVELDVLRSLLRIAHDMNFLKVDSLGYIVAQIDEVGKMRGGWVKRYKSSKSDV